MDGSKGYGNFPHQQTEQNCGAVLIPELHGQWLNNGGEYDMNEIQAEVEIDFLKLTVKRLNSKIDRLQKEVRHCRNELCQKCGNYKYEYIGACDGCRFAHGGEWERDLDGL